VTIFAKNKAFNEKLREGKTKRVNFSLDTAAYESSQPKWKNYEKVKPFLEKESQEFIEEEFKEQDNTFPGIEGQVSGLSDMFPGTFTSYQDALAGGFQGTMEEWLQQQSIPQIDRPLAGGGRIALSAGTAAQVPNYLQTARKIYNVGKKIFNSFKVSSEP
jgi:hypothetical protein